MSLKELRKEKIELLRDFCIKLNKEQKVEFDELQTEGDINRYVHRLIWDKL